MSAALLLATAAWVAAQTPAPPLHVGSKAFTEGVILGDLATLAIRASGHAAEHTRELGGTRLVFEALKRGDIDVYAEYTGTLKEELYPGVDDVDAALQKDGLRRTPELGFNNSYGLAMRADTAARLHVARISDLARLTQKELGAPVGVSNEFLARKDGWPGLAARYGLSLAPQGLAHAIAYKALGEGGIAVTDCYTTDAEIAALHLVVLDDDLGYFPRYDALYLYRAGAAAAVAPALAPLAGAVSDDAMRAMNAAVRVGKRSEVDVAADFLAHLASPTAAVAVAVPAAPATPAAPAATSAGVRVARVLVRTREHAALVGVAFAVSVVFGVPLGVAATRRRKLGEALLGVVGIAQTIPSLALLVLFVPLVGIGSVPAVFAMVLYGLLPVVRNTHAGLTGIAPSLRDAAHAIGLTPAQRLFSVELPLASPSILAGAQTSAIISVGTATIGALVGAGGYGQSILTGIRLADTGLILEGALPAAAMALLFQGVFLVVERLVVPAGLRLAPRARS